MVKQYRKKPIVIEAIQWTGKIEQEIIRFMEGYPFSWSHDLFYIQTLEGEMKADVGDWIIKGIKGEFYPCKPDIFEKTYEPVNTQPLKMEIKNPECPKCKTIMLFSFCNKGYLWHCNNCDTDMPINIYSLDKGKLREKILEIQYEDNCIENCEKLNGGETDCAECQTDSILSLIQPKIDWEGLKASNPYTDTTLCGKYALPDNFNLNTHNREIWNMGVEACQKIVEG